MQIRLIECIIICLALTGCSAGAGSSSALQAIKAEQLFTSLQCGGQGNAALVHWIADESNYGELKGDIASAVMGKSDQNLPHVDFSTHGVVMVGMGEKSTAGYSLALGKQEVKVEKGVATINLSWQEPPVGAILAQMLTSPCVLISLPKNDFSRIRIIDQNSKIRSEAMLQSSK